MKVAIAFSTKDRTELTKQTWPRLQLGMLNGLYDLFWFDGSSTPEGEQLAHDLGFPGASVEHNVRGGADAAIVYALTHLLRHPANYEAIGLWENDVLVHEDWFGPTHALFARGGADGLEVGAVSPRSYEDRILIQRDGHAVMHNLGAGAVIFTREAAKIILDNYRTGWTLENRRIFMQVSGIDIGRHWCFRGGQHHITGDWAFDAILARHGLASLALTPSLAEMIGQSPSLEEQGLRLVHEPVELLRDDKVFATYRDRLNSIYWGERRVPGGSHLRGDDGTFTIFPHQIESIGGKYEGDWKLKWAQGFGPFAYKTPDNAADMWLPTLTVPVSGPCSFLVSGGEKGGRVEVEDSVSGYKVSPELAPEGSGQVMQLFVPAAVSYREIRMTALTPGVILYGLQTHEPQPTVNAFHFDWSKLPPV